MSDAATTSTASVASRAHSRGRVADCKRPKQSRFNAETKVADNCDFCLHTRFAEGRKPACVESCKYDALVFGNVNDPYSYISRLIRAKDTVRIRPELGTRPSLRYIPFVKKGA